MKKVTENTPECYEQVAASLEREERQDLPQGQGKQFSKYVFTHAYRHTALVVNERFATEKSTFFFP